MPSTSPKDVLALGRRIVNELQLDARESVATRWLAHHAAELIQQAESSEGPEKTAAQERAVATILKLWEKRRELPGDVDPLGTYRKAIQVLARLAPDADPWTRYRGQGGFEDLLSHIFDIVRRSVVAGVLLTQVDRPSVVGTEKLSFLDPEEVTLHGALAEWTSFFSSRSRRPDISVIFALSDDDAEIVTPDEPGPATGPALADARVGAESADCRNQASVQSALLAHLETAHRNLGELITRWKEASTTPANDEGRSPAADVDSSDEE